MKELEEMKKSFDEFMAKAEQTLQRMKGTKQILDKEEKEYLKAVLKPFKKKILYIRKSPQYEHDYSYNENIIFVLQNDDCGLLPYFIKNTMYKGMELNKEYTLKELGLFEGE